MKKGFFFYYFILLLHLTIPPSQCQTISPDAEWPCFRRDLYNTGISHLAGPLTNLKEMWTFSLGGGISLAKMFDIDDDLYPEIAILAHSLNEHLTMLDNSGSVGETI